MSEGKISLTTGPIWFSFKAGLAILTINSTKKITKPLEVIYVFNVTEEGWVRRGGKGVVGKFPFRFDCQNIIPFSL